MNEAEPELIYADEILVILLDEVSIAETNHGAASSAALS